MLKRKIIDRLEKWYLSGHYKAPLVFGARQVGKTTARHNLPPIVYGIIDIGKVLETQRFYVVLPKTTQIRFKIGLKRNTHIPYASVQSYKIYLRNKYTFQKK